MKLPAYLFSLMMTLVSLSVAAQDIMVRATLDTNRALIGDQLTLRLQVEQISGQWQVTFPTIQNNLTQNIEVVTAMAPDTAVSSDHTLITQDLLITVFDTGFFEIPAFSFTVRSQQVTDTITTLPVAFEILSVAADSTIRDIKAVYKAPLTIRELTPYLLALIGVWLAIWLILYYLRKRKEKRSGQLLPVYSEPAEVTALRELNQLKEEKPWMNNRVKYYYIRMSEILRAYLERQFNMKALEQTTGEIMDSLQQTKLEPSEYKSLMDLLRLADFVKFAKVIPDPEQNALQVDIAIDFVNSSAEIVRSSQPAAEEEPVNAEDSGAENANPVNNKN